VCGEVMKKIVIFIVPVFLFIFFSVSCNSGDPANNSAGSNDGNNYYDEDITGLPDNSENPDDGKLPVEEEDDDPFEDKDYTEGFCGCYGVEYKLPQKYADNPQWCMADEDGDGIVNCIEAPNGALVDTDEDGTSDYRDTDSDGDGIPDNYECPDVIGEKDENGKYIGMPYCRDTDEDGVPDYRDKDSDGDGIPDYHECPGFEEEEQCRDSDEDGTPDYIDIDSDGDGIPDWYECPQFDEDEGCVDSNKNGTPDYLDTDSDGDGIPDNEECPDFYDGNKCVDTDSDGVPDYLDLDSDGDGIPDKDELFCANIGKSCRTFSDCDGDGVDDNTEIAAGSDPCVSDPEFYEGHFYVVLPYQEPEVEEPLQFGTEIQKLDFVISLDLSGSMSYARDNLKQDIVNVVINGIKGVVPDPAFSISSFASIEGSPYFMDQTITKDSTAVYNAVHALGQEGGGEIESQYEAMYQAVTGAGFEGDLLRATFDFDKWLPDEPFYRIYSEVRIDSQNCTGQLGTIGGACFREHALPVVMLVTDEQLYDINKDWVSDTQGGITKLRYKWRESKPDEGHYEDEVIAAFNEINAKFIGVIGSGLGGLLMDIEKRMKNIADGTKSKGIDENKYFIYEVGFFGTGLSDDIVGAVDDILHNIQMDIDTENESVTNIHTIDTTQFIKSVTASHSDPPEAYESKVDNKFFKVKPKTDLFFDVVFENTIFEPATTQNTLFRAKIHVFGEGAILDTREVYIIVPGKKSEPGGIQS
jgi:hypothetical protein